MNAISLFAILLFEFSSNRATDACIAAAGVALLNVSYVGRVGMTIFVTRQVDTVTST